MLKVTQFVSIDDGIILDVDINIDQKTALLVTDVKNVFLTVDGWDRHVWRLTDMPHLRRVRWIFENEVACWTTRTNGECTDAVLVCSEVENQFLAVSTPHHIIGGKSVSYATYGEEKYLGSEDGDIEAHMIVAFDRNGRVTFGLKEFLRKTSWRSDPIEVSAACITEDDQLVISFYGCPGLWIMDSSKNNLSCIPGSRELDQVSAIAKCSDGLILLSSIDGDKIRFCHFDIRSGSLIHDDDIEISTLFPSVVSKQSNYNNVSIHGCPGGIIVVKGIDSAFSVTL